LRVPTELKKFIFFLLRCLYFYLDGGGGSNNLLRRMVVVIVVVVWHFEWLLVDREDRGNDPNEEELFRSVVNIPSPQSNISVKGNSFVSQ